MLAQAFRTNGSRVSEIDLTDDAVRAAPGSMIAHVGEAAFRNAGTGGGDGLRAALERQATGGPSSLLAFGATPELGTGTFLASGSGPVIVAAPPLRVDRGPWSTGAAGAPLYALRMDPDVDPDRDDDAGGRPPGLDAVADALYRRRPDAFVPARDNAVAAARTAGDRDLARAVGRLRRPTRAAWLANLLAQERGEQLAGLLALAGDLAAAQRTLDGSALRALSAQRRRLVAAMAREGARLAAQAGDAATESVLRDLEGILDAALADPEIAREVRSGRLTRTVRWSGFGPVGAGSDPGSGGPPDGAAHLAPDSVEPAGSPADRAGRPPPLARAAAPDATATGPPTESAGGGAAEQEQRERAERAAREEAERAAERAERLARERTERQGAVDEAEQAQAAARDRAADAESERAGAEATHVDARSRVTDLAAELDDAREQERAAAAAERAAAAAARDAVREAGGAATRTERARARLADLDAAT